MFNSAYFITFSKRISRIFTVGLFLGLCAVDARAQAWVVYEEPFNNGFGDFTDEGRVYTGSYGVRLRGGGFADTTLTSSAINVSNFENLVISYDRKVFGLDYNESAQLQVSIDGGAVYTIVDSVQHGEGRVSIPLTQGIFANAQSIRLRFAIDSSSFFESYTISDLVIEGKLKTVCDADAACEDYPAFSTLMSRAEANGTCSVERMRSGLATVYIPTDPRDPTARFNALVWGNGLGNEADTYNNVLTSVASHCIAIAVVNTTSDTAGAAMAEAFDTLRLNFSDSLLPDARVCTAGHSTGGGVAYNAAPLVNADCVIAVQPDTVYSVQILQPLDSDVEAIAFASSADTLAPAEQNRPNLSDNSEILTQITTEGESHFTITSEQGGSVGTLLRMASMAQLSTNEDLRKSNRRAFFGPDTYSKASADHPEIHDVYFNSESLNTNP